MKPSQLEQARSLYLKTDLSKTEIADRVGISRPTLYNWVRDNNWDTIKQSEASMPLYLAENCYSIMLRIQQSILSRDTSENPVTPKEVNMLYKITATIGKLKTRGTLSEALEMNTYFLEFVDTHHPELIDTISPLVDAYILSRAKAQAPPVHFYAPGAGIAKGATEAVSKTAAAHPSAPSRIPDAPASDHGADEALLSPEELQQAQLELLGTLQEFLKDTPYANPMPPVQESTKPAAPPQKPTTAPMPQHLPRAQRRKLARQQTGKKVVSGVK